MAFLGGALTGLLGGSEPTPATGGIGIIPTLPTLPLSIPGISLPGITPIFPTGSDSLSASGSSSASASALPSSLSLSSSPSSLSSAPSSPAFTPTSASPSSAPTPTDLSTGADGVVQTVSHTVTVSESGASTQSAAPQHHTSFLQNKALSGAVFGLAGLVGLVLIVILITFALRRRRRSRLMDDAVSFDPGLVDRYDGSEKGHSSNPSLGTMGSTPYGGPVTGYGTYNPEPVQQHSYGGPQQAYYGGPQQPEYYGAPQNAQQPYYSPYVPPMADAPPATSLANPSRGTHNIPRVPVPAKALPAEFGSSDQDNRLSIEESEFWAKTLKVTNE